MYKKLFAVSAAALVLSACSSTEPETNTELKIQCETTQSLVGGWKNAEVTPEATQSAQLAIASMEGTHTLKDIQSVQQQVVAGMNYRVTFTIEDDTAYVAKVFRNLQGEYKIASLQPKTLVNECTQEQSKDAQDQE